MKNLPSNSGGSIKEGIWIIFKDGENIIRIWVSSITGKEIVYLNDRVVSRSSKWSFASQHEFKNDQGVVYRVELKSVQKMKELEFTFKKDGTVLSCKRVIFFADDFIKPSNVVNVLIVVIVSVCTTLFTRYYDPSILQMLLFLMSFFGILLAVGGGMVVYFKREEPYEVVDITG